MKFGKKLCCMLGLVVGMLALAGCEKSENTVVLNNEASEDSVSISTEQNNEAEKYLTEEEENATESVEVITQENAVESAEDNAQEVVTEQAFSFADVSGYEFYFSSGAGGWSTVMHIHEDGTFDGNYLDSDMGVTGEGYPNGVVYYCDFKGKFTQPQIVNAYTYSMRVEELTMANEPGTEEIKDDICYCYTTPYGMEETEDIYIYLPGSPIAELPEGFKYWVGYVNPESMEETELPYYGLYNVTPEYGFSSYAMQEETVDATEENLTDIEAELAAVEAEASVINEQLQSGMLSQGDLNMLSGELYKLWDDELNSIWARLKETLDADTMAALTEKQREWIAWKESEIEAEGAEHGMGTIRPLMENDKAAELTREKVYELAELLK